jgi:DMSO/TMAO reductase YedYZ heme-binding membrane subunit
MKSSATRNRLTVMLVGIDVIVAVVVALASGYTGPEDVLTLVGIGEVYGLISAGFLYLTLLVSPLTHAFPHIPGKETLFLARRGLGLSSLIFALPHAAVSFFGPLRGFDGIPFFDPYTAWALIFGLAGLIIMILLGMTAWDGAVARLGHTRWKALHRTVYLAGVLMFVHLVLVGPHYASPRSLWMFATLVLVGWLVYLQARRFDAWWAKKFPKDKRYGPAALVTAALITAAWFWTLGSPEEAKNVSGEVRWVTGHHGMLIPVPTEETKP